MTTSQQPWKETLFRSFPIIAKPTTLFVLLCLLSTFWLLTTIIDKARTFTANGTETLGSVASFSAESLMTQNSGQDEILMSEPPSLSVGEEGTGRVDALPAESVGTETSGQDEILTEDDEDSDSDDGDESLEESSGLDAVRVEVIGRDSEGEAEQEPGKAVFVGDMGGNGSDSASDERKEMPLSSHSDFGESVGLASVVPNLEDLGTEGCDIYDGRWVFDDSYPLYTSDSCPFIDEGFSCEANGRIDTSYMKWRWQPHSCNIPRFDPVKMLEAIRGKRLVFVGDSINRNQWESMLCLLSAAISDRSKVYEARKRRITKYNGNYNFKFPDFGCSVEYYVTHFLVQESKARVGTKRRKTLRIDAIDKTSSRWRGADILVFNSAHWWSHHKTKAGLNYFQEGNQVYSHLDVSSAFRKALTTWASWVDKHVNPRKTQVFFRSSAPSHFSGGEWNSGGHCKESTQPLNNTSSRQIPEMSIILEQTVKQMRTPVTILNITNLSGLRIDGHPSIYGQKPDNRRRSNIQDCSHWCLPGVPDIWNELIYYQLLLSRRENASR